MSDDTLTAALARADAAEREARRLEESYQGMIDRLDAAWSERVEELKILHERALNERDAAHDVIAQVRAVLRDLCASAERASKTLDEYSELSDRYHALDQAVQALREALAGRYGVRRG
jgi:chromosome segregation ATPase